MFIISDMRGDQRQWFLREFLPKERFKLMQLLRNCKVFGGIALSRSNRVTMMSCFVFWHGRGCFSHESFRGSYQDFDAALRTEKSRPAPVPRPAAQSTDCLDHDILHLRSGEGWWDPRTTWSQDFDSQPAVPWAKHVGTGHSRFSAVKTVKRAYKRACKRAQASPVSRQVGSLSNST